MFHKIVPTVTPFKEGRVDAKMLRNHVDRLFKDGIDLIFLCGTTGLGPSLTRREKTQCLEALADFSDRIIFQVGSLNLDDSMALAKLAKRFGARAIASYPPYFYPRVTDEWAARHLAALSKVYPAIAYNFPLATGYDITPSVIKRAMKLGGEVIGVKDTVADVGHMLSFKYELGEEFVVYSGPDPLILSSARLGLDGAIAGTGNFAPELMVKIGKDPDSNTAAKAQELITRLGGIARKYGQWAANYVMVKMIRGYDVGDPRRPIFPLSAAQEEALRKELNSVYHLAKANGREGIRE